ncbi:hypothetical protein ACFX41_24985 [Priestia sp. YIM B13546]|uniref:hypothetical protein n=1 Tax=Priestia sp. YIM B13546 TaxID=3366302 RepID=UPI003672358F
MLKDLKIYPGTEIKDTDYFDGGYTEDSLQFWYAVRTKIKPIVKAKMEYDQSDHRLVLHTSDEVKIYLSGCGSHGYGEGARATNFILKDCGFDPCEVNLKSRSHGPFEIKKGHRGINERSVDCDIDYPYRDSLNHSEEPIERFEWIKNNTELTERQKIINMNKLTTSSLYNCPPHDRKIEVSVNELKGLLQGFSEAMNYMQEALPDTVYGEINSKSKSGLLRILKQVDTSFKY